MDEWRRADRPRECQDERQPRGHLHKQLYGSTKKKSADSLSQPQGAQSLSAYCAAANLYQPPAIIKQLNSKHHKHLARNYAHLNRPEVDSTSSSSSEDEMSTLNSSGQLPLARMQRKMLAFFYVYAIVVATLFLTYVAYCFVQSSHQWRRQQQQAHQSQSQQQQQRSAPLQTANQIDQVSSGGEFEAKLALLERYIELMAADLEETKGRLKERERCGCSVGCSFNGTRYEDGASFKGENQCDNCSCKSGKIVCAPIKCPKLSCDLSEQVEPSGKCCPVCMKKCKYNNTLVKHAQVFYPPAETGKSGPRKQCKCHDGLIKCELVKTPMSTTHKPRTVSQLS